MSNGSKLDIYCRKCDAVTWIDAGEWDATRQVKCSGCGATICLLTCPKCETGWYSNDPDDPCPECEEKAALLAKVHSGDPCGLLQRPCPWCARPLRVRDYLRGSRLCIYCDKPIDVVGTRRAAMISIVCIAAVIAAVAVADAFITWPGLRLVLLVVLFLTLVVTGLIVYPRLVRLDRGDIAGDDEQMP